MKIKINKLYFCFFIVLFFIAGLFFYDPITAYFSQDDFFHMRVIMDRNFSDIPTFFVSEQEEYAFYRPLSRETYNLIMYKVFGLNSFAFHIVNFLLIFLNGLLVFKFSQLLTNNRKAVILALLLYIFSSVHSIELYYLASFQTLIAATFVLGGLIAYFKFLNKSKKIFWYLSILFFILGIFSHESAVVFLGLITILEFKTLGISKEKAIKFLLHISPFLLILSFRFIIHYFGSGLDQQSPYHPSLNVKDIFNTLSWFTLWSFGMPEMLVDFATLTLNFNPNLFRFYSYYTNSVFPLFGLILLSLLLITINLLFKNWRNKRSLSIDKNIWFLGLGYLISLGPFLLFPNHKFVYYLTIPILFFCAFCGLLLGKYWDLGKSHKFLIVMFVLAYIAISHQTVNLNKITHWAAKRANSANFLVNDLLNRYKQIPQESIFYIKNDPEYPFIAKEWGTSSKQAFYILSGADAFKLIFRDPSIKAYYEDVTGPPKEEKNLHIYEARFPY